MINEDELCEYDGELIDEEIDDGYEETYDELDVNDDD